LIASRNIPVIGADESANAEMERQHREYRRLGAVNQQSPATRRCEWI
jgi:hypothetical protein